MCDDEQKAASNLLASDYDELQHTTRAHRKELAVLRKGKPETFFKPVKIDQAGEQKNEQVIQIRTMLLNYPRLPNNYRNVTWREVERVTKERKEHHDQLQTLVNAFLEGSHVVTRSVNSKRNF